MVEAAPIPDEAKVTAPTNLIGARLRQIRTVRKMSLRTLGARVGVTASLLSQIETGQVNPSVDTLYALAEGLGVPTCYFFEEDEDHARHAGAPVADQVGPTVRATNRRYVELAHGVVWESLLPAEEPEFEWCEVFYPPGAISADVMERHNGRHYLMLLEGSLTVQLAFTDHRLEPGDSMAFDAIIPHQLRNEGTTSTRALVCVLKRYQAGSADSGDTAFSIETCLG